MAGNSAQLVLDLDALRTLNQELTQSSGALQGLAELTATLVGEVGHPDLSHHLQDFSKSWTDNRAKLIEDVKTLATQVLAVVEGVENTDSSLQGALADSGSAT